VTSIADCREIRQALGVYVLGAIEPAERSTVDEHLSGCPECREELASLAGLPALLHRVPLAEAERLAAPDSGSDDELLSEELLHSLLVRSARVRRVRLWRGLAAAAAVVVLAVGAGAAGAQVLHGGSSASASSPLANVRGVHHWQRVSSTDPQTGVRLTVDYAPLTWGTVMAANVSGLKPGIVCQFVVTDTAGHNTVVGGWRLTYGHWPMWYPASTAVTDQHLRSFEVTSGGKVLAEVPAS
jgi:anti-sigma factor RsiW